MATTRLRLSEYSRLSESDQKERVRALAEVGHGALDGELADLESAITSLELRHQMSTATMLRRVQSNAIDLTPDICHWQILAEIRDRVARVQ